MCCTIALHPRSRWCNGLAPLQQWPRYRQGPGFESHLRPVEVFTRNKVSPLNNRTTILRLVSCAPINQLKTIKSTKRVQQFSVGRHTYTWQPMVAAKPMQNHLLLLLLSAAHCNLVCQGRAILGSLAKQIFELGFFIDLIILNNTLEVYIRSMGFSKNKRYGYNKLLTS